MERSEIEEEYILDVTELLDEAESAILNLNDPSKSADSWNTVLRVLHSIKGSAGMFGFKHLEEHIHKVEDLCVQYNQNTHQEVLEDIGNYILNASDRVRLYLLNDDKSVFNEMVYFECIDEYVNHLGAGPEEQKSPHKNTSKDQSKDSYRVFIIDDDEQILEFYEEYFSDLNISIEKDSSPEVGLERILSNPPDIIILDYKMPHLSGLELHHKLKEKGLDIPTIFATGVDDVAIYEELSQHGAFAIITKPINKSMLIYTLNQALKVVDKHNALKKSLKLVRTYYDCLRQHYEDNGKGHRIKHLKNEILDLYKLL